MPEFYMDERCGAWQVGQDPAHGKVEFRIFFPDRTKDPTQYSATGRPSYGDPRISSVQVAGDFMSQLGLTNWDKATAPEMIKTSHAKGWMWSYQSPVALTSGFYEYKYWVTFQSGETRFVTDPCTRYGGSEQQNSAFVIGGSTPAQNVIAPLAGGRKHPRDLIVYELMLDDFTDEYRGYRAPLDAAIDRFDYLANDLGINAILFLPWTTWPNEGYSWGYIPSQYFSVEYRYANALNAPAEKLSWLKRLVHECHQRGIHVVMDGVFNHAGDVEADPATDAANGFPYRWLYQDTQDSPYCGSFGGTFSSLLDLDYNNGCTQEFIRDVCFYWIDNFGLDGIRFDNTTNFYIDGDARGLPTLLSDIRSHVADPLFSLTLEHLNMDAARVTNSTAATGYWNNELYQRTFDFLWNGAVDNRIMNALNTHAGLDPAKAATIYLSNHDHSHVAWQAGVRNNNGGLEWYKVQPYAIALMTAPGTVMIQNAQEFAEDHWIMEDDHGTGRRVKPRPIRWGFMNDSIGLAFRNVLAKLIRIRKQYAALRSDNFYPGSWETWMSKFNEMGYGVDADRGLVIFHRWGNDEHGALQRFIVLLNFTASDQTVDVPFPANGVWRDLLNEQNVSVGGYWLRHVTVESNWGHVYFQ